MPSGLVGDLVSQDEGQRIVIHAGLLQQPKGHDNNSLLVALGDDFGRGQHMKGEAQGGGGAGYANELSEDASGPQNGWMIIRQGPVMRALELKGALRCAE